MASLFSARCAQNPTRGPLPLWVPAFAGAARDVTLLRYLRGCEQNASDLICRDPLFKVMTLDAQEFIRRFLLHVLTSGFMRIRHYGLLANRAKGVKLAAARAALDYQPLSTPAKAESVEAFWQRVAALDIHRCAYCKTGRMRAVGPISVPKARAPPQPP